MDLPDELENKAGPFPVWVWGAAIGVIVIGVWWYRNNSSGTTAASTGTLYDPTALDNAALYSGNNANASNASNATASTAKVARTNVAWLRQCMVYETGKHRNALTVQRALTRYLMSKPLNDKQHAIVSDALTHIGLPPKPPKLVSPVKHPHDGGGGDGNPHTPPGGRLASDAGEGEGVLSTAPEHDTSTEPHMARTSVSGFHLFDTSPGDTPASVAHAVYGTSAPYYVERVRSANGVGSADEFPGGIRVKVPYMPTTSAVPQGRRRPSSV